MSCAVQLAMMLHMLDPQSVVLESNGGRPAGIRRAGAWRVLHRFQRGRRNVTAIC